MLLVVDLCLESRALQPLLFQELPLLFNLGLELRELHIQFVKLLL